MFKKVLIAEDHESANISVQKTLTDLQILNSSYVFYCDDALLQLKKANEQVEPFDLLITDLSFEEDHPPQQIKDGMALIAAAKVLQSNLKVLVFSSENKPVLIDQLFKEFGINAYVRKARHDAKDLKRAIEAVSQGKKYLSED